MQQAQIRKAVSSTKRQWLKSGSPDSFERTVESGDPGEPEPLTVSIRHHETHPLGSTGYKVTVTGTSSNGATEPPAMHRETFSMTNGVMYPED